MRLLIGSTNPGKIKEFQSILSYPHLEFVTPDDIGLDAGFDVPETATSFRGNALLKAKAFAQKTELPSICDDSGLQVDALNGRPGVYSKRYGANDHQRNLKLLAELRDIPKAKRTARFVCVVAFFDPQTRTSITRSGKVEGLIAPKEQGSGGFGYDPVFIPLEGDGRTFGELDQDFKNQISHRARALQNIKPLLQKHFS